ncbi:hypothetical protein [Burkholderia ubonensis]|uniref:hypothetical protein n=1 Tax=Burkholderia ubonensis TaxID=101571 RepID=UPI0012F7ED26|nr:hypothetical protein [Burkholderia ubonensis]
MSDRLSACYHRMMNEPVYRERAEKARKKPLEQRVAVLACNAMLFGSLTPAAALMLGRPFGFWFAVALALTGLYSLAGFLIDSTVLTMDLRELEAQKRASVVPDVRRDDGASTP